ncbi:MAG: hypothetical protein CO031_01750 [Candidatus Nealsonbacteria bacterium CG_4_9_14_0_2_um_filter_37_38]|uniref:Diacylglycerol kinase n=1 Tax=Candidatus Nealsonbacteria bacterium CG_4_10_14_0_8_um_filter_37_14 TaxID=1974684 RepID=A0A2M7R6Z6_9BACT|nr:MAG: hypothetical protein COV63_00215 [Candidatus Nealsonbacteria bacterium CG11_big_fil_rev_8_21_14_0_20_37_68]PIW91868.1 MAG: hypothetical protein COZ89_02895 [Candidatus Nealsonbacteria bacterium CG_4_8_14_3_um_filter_37_23]PIY89198.1 MAG: hypothetical protein COY73_01620 [Candidatus Nealsonbacteria bacterium CG_4_10_14_0_8_um_filter_37_14]PJC51610.1 MAG: hypothetical protein CO031_01750 [Candidatus Nealsonbacteria bacterium CG_4_9_14_0_2_um_filter_37_38]
MFLGINFKKLVNSFKFAISGIKIAFQEEQTFRIEILIAILVIIAMFYFNLLLIERMVIFIIIFLVLTVELINSLLERILDITLPLFDIRVKKIKDISSAMVLFSYFIAIIIGALIFLPYLLTGT